MYRLSYIRSRFKQFNPANPTLIFFTLAMLAIIAALWLYFFNINNSHNAIKRDSTPLAIIADKDTITVAEYRFRYASSPHTGQGLQARREFLEALIIERILALKADEENLQEIKSVEIMNNQLNSESRVEELLKNEVNSRVSIDEEELHKHFLRITRDLFLDAWVFADSVQAFKTAKDIYGGVNFESANISSPAEGRLFLKHYRLKWNQSLAEFEDLAYSLDDGEVGGPVKLENKWWLIRNVGFELHQIPSEQTYYSLAPWIKDALTNRASESAQNQFIKESMTGMKMNIDPKAFEKLVEFLYETLPQGQREYGSNPSLIARGDPVLKPGKKNEDLYNSFKDEQLLSIGDENNSRQISIEQMIEYLYASPKPLIRFDDINQFKHEVHSKIVWIMEFRQLDNIAEERHLDNNRTVAMNQKMWSRHILASEMFRTLLRSENSEAITDSTLSNQDKIGKWLEEEGSKYPVTWYPEKLEPLNLVDFPVIFRKKHFPNRPATPLPVGYYWVDKWEPNYTTTP